MPSPDHVKNAQNPNDSSGRNRRWTKYLAATVLICLIAGAGFAAYHLWTLVNAVSQVESVAVVPLPASNQNYPTATGDELVSLVITPVDGLRPTEFAAVSTDTAGSSAVSTTAASVLSDASDDDQTSPSRLSILQEVVEAGANNGDPGLSSVWNGQTSLNVLVIGIDSRADGGDENADVIVIAHLDLVNHAVSAVSLPRDLVVQIPGYGEDKINSAYNHGVMDAPGDPVAGVARVRDTVESSFGIQIDGYFLIDFAGFEKIVDAVGGIEIDVPYQIVDTEYPIEGYGVKTITFEPGLQQMNGETALQYVRTRHSDDDDARRERQFQVMLALFERGGSFDSITEADDLILALSETVQTSFPLDQQLTLARLGFTMNESDIAFAVLTQPLLVPGWTADGRWVYTGDMIVISEYIRQSLRTESPVLQSLSQ